MDKKNSETAKAPDTVNKIELVLSLDPDTLRLTITGSAPTHEAALAMIRRAEFEYEKLIQGTGKASGLVTPNAVPYHIARRGFGN